MFAFKFEGHTKKCPRKINKIVPCG